MTRKTLIMLGSAALISGVAQAALTIADGDFETGFINLDPNASATDIDRDRASDYEMVGDGWYAPSNTQTWELMPVGGVGNSRYGKQASGNNRGMFSLITDNKANTGVQTLSVDLLVPDTANDKLLIKVWGVNDTDIGTAGIQWDGQQIDLSGPFENTDGLDIHAGTQDAFLQGTGVFDELLSTDAAALGFSPSGSWQTDAEFSFDLGATGYDQVIVGFSMWNADAAPNGGIDNLSVVPEPATLGLIGFCGASLLFIRRRFKN